MKNLIITIALVVLIAMFSVFQIDVNTMTREQESLKEASDEAANAAALELDAEMYGEGYIVFDTSRGVASAFEIIQEETGVHDDFTANGEYYTENMDFYAYFFDDTNVAKKYHNNVLMDSFAFSWGTSASSCSDITTLTGEDFVINRPSIVIIVDAGEPNLRLNFLHDKANIKKMSVFEVDYPH